AAESGAQWFYLVPSGHNPTGQTLAKTQRTELLELAGKFGLTLVEDDVYGELQYGGVAEPLIAKQRENLIHIGSFSKILAPGLRVGWLCAESRIVRQLMRIKQAA